MGLCLSQRYYLSSKRAHDRGPARLAHGVKDGHCDGRMCPGRGHAFRLGDVAQSHCGLDGPQTYRRTPALTFRMGGEVADMEIEQRV